MTIRATEIGWRVVGDFRRCWKSLVITDLAFKVVLFVLLAPLGGLIVRGILWLQGATVIADQDILLLALSPLGLAGLVLIGAVALATVGFELACLMTIGFGVATGVDVGFLDALSYVTRRAVPVARLAVAITARVLLRLTPFLLVGALVFFLLLTEFDINFYLSERPPAFWLASALLGAIVVGALAMLVPGVIGWLVALPIVLFEAVPPAAALAVSGERTRGSRRGLAILLGLWALTSLAASAIVLGAVRLVGLWFVAPAVEGRLALLLPAVGALALTWVAANELVSLLSSSLFALGTTRVYQGADPPSSQSWQSAVTGFVGVAARRLPRVRWLTATAAALMVAALTGYYLLSSVRSDVDIDIIAHRGAAAEAPENTLAAFDRAVTDGADWVELDVLETADGEVVVVHDRDLMRVAGVNLDIADATVDQLRDIDVGSWFGPAFSDERVPTLAEALELCRDRIGVVIELKYFGRNERLEERVVEIVETAGMASQILVMSLNREAVGTMRELRPEWRVGLITAVAVGNLLTVDADFLAVHGSIATPLFIRDAHAAGKDVFVWPIYDRVEKVRMISRGADGLITNAPAMGREVADTLEVMTQVERLAVDMALWIGAIPEASPAETNDLDGAATSRFTK